MKFIPRKADDSVNVSKTHPLIELSWMLAGLVFLCGVVFALLGLITDMVVARTPVKVEKMLQTIALDRFPGEENQDLTKLLDQLLNQLPPESPLKQYDFKLYVSEEDEINAIALPGGNIVVFKGLLKQIDSENELSMILGHELGHFLHRDHLRGLGRGLGVMVGVTLLFGVDSTASDIVANSMLSFQAQYSQEQEEAADLHGLTLLVQQYGHAGGSTDFFTRLSKDEPGRLPYLLASHPHPLDRVEKLNTVIQENGYPTKATIPFHYQQR